MVSDGVNGAVKTLIRRMEIRNFKALRKVDIDLERFTVIAGPNSSGKSSILQALALFPQWIQQVSTQPGQIHPETWQTYGSNGDLDLTSYSNFLSWHFRATRTQMSPHQSSWQKYVEVAEGTPISTWKPVQVIDKPYNVDLLALDPRKLAAPSNPQTNPRMTNDGTGFGSEFILLNVRRPEVFARLQELTRTLFPFIERIRGDRMPIQLFRENRTEAYLGEIVLFDSPGAIGIPAEHMSDGTLLGVGYLTRLITTESDQLILIDDLDRGLHPKAQWEFVRILRRLLELLPGLQIVATTHSPFILDEMKPEEVRLTTRLDDGTVACAPIMDHPDFERWKLEMSPGEFWTTIGEKWIGEVHAEASPK